MPDLPLPHESFREYLIRATREAEIARRAGGHACLVGPSYARQDPCPACSAITASRSTASRSPLFPTPTEALLGEVLETLSSMTSEDFARGADRELRRKIATFLGLNLEDYSL